MTLASRRAGEGRQPWARLSVQAYDKGRRAARRGLSQREPERAQWPVRKLLGGNQQPLRQHPDLNEAGNEFTVFPTLPSSSVSCDTGSCTKLSDGNLRSKAFTAVVYEISDAINFKSHYQFTHQWGRKITTYFSHQWWTTKISVALLRYTWRPANCVYVKCKIS